MQHGPEKFTPWQGCTCFHCRNVGKHGNYKRFYKQVLSHRRWRHESKARIRQGDYTHFVIGTGYRS